MTDSPPSRMSLAARHRPRRFADVVGQEHVRDILAQAVAHGTLPQQLLFCGGSGLGKTTLARVTAAALLCPSPVTSDAGADACGTCQSCRDVFGLDGVAHPDVVEVDAASHGGKDEIRSLAERAQLAPVRGPVKVYIIDEAHAMSGAGGSALLKLLEEPPAHVVFMLASTDPQRILKTNRGRCTEFTLVRPGRGDIARHVQQVATAEGWMVDAPTADVVVEATDPDLGVRGVLMTLEKLAPALSGGTVSAEQVKDLLSHADSGLEAALRSGDPAAILDAVDHTCQKSGDAVARRTVVRHAHQSLRDAALAGGDLIEPTAILGAVLRAPAGVAGTCLAAMAAARCVPLTSITEGGDFREGISGGFGYPPQEIPAPPAPQDPGTTPQHGPVEELLDSLPPPTEPPQDWMDEEDVTVDPHRAGVSSRSAPRQHPGLPGTGTVPNPVATRMQLDELRAQIDSGSDPFDVTVTHDGGGDNGDRAPRADAETESATHPGASSVEPAPQALGVAQVTPQDTPAVPAPAVSESGPAGDSPPLAKAFLTVLTDSFPEQAGRIIRSGITVTAGPGRVTFHGTADELLLLRDEQMNKACRTCAWQLGVRLKAEPSP